MQLDPEGRIVTSNRRMHDLTALRHVQIVRRRLIDLFVERDREPARLALAKLRTEPRVSFQACLETTGLWLDVQLTRIDGGDPAVSVLAIARDVTETRRLEAEVLRREKEESLGLLVGGIAHDLNNILTAVIGNASDAADQVAPGSTIAQVLADVQVAGERAAELGQSMLAYLGQAPSVVARVDLDQLVRDTVRVIGPLLGAGASVRVDDIASDAIVAGDASQLGQVVMNLVTNAAQALETRGDIRIATDSTTLPDDGGELRPQPLEGRFARVVVADNGPGDAVVLDSSLPDADGSEVAKAMRELMPGLPILRSSGYQVEDLVPAGEPFLAKPYRVSQLLEAVESLLAGGSQH